MEVVKDEVDQAQQTKHLTKEQRNRQRAMQNLNQEVTNMVSRLVNQWYQFFLDNDPASEAIMGKQKEVSAKWKMYCHRRKLKAQMFGLVDDSIVQLIEEYQQLRVEKKNSVNSEPPTILQRCLGIFRKRQKAAK